MMRILGKMLTPEFLVIFGVVCILAGSGIAGGHHQRLGDAASGIALAIGGAGSLVSAALLRRTS